MKYFIYARKSTESEDRQMASIEDQINEMQKIAANYQLSVIDIISEAKSAKQPGRIEFNKMLKRIRQGEADGILCWKLNRLARNPIDGGEISWLLQRNVIRHIQTYGREYKSSDNVLMMQVEFGMANQYINDLSVDVKRGLRKKAERGWYPLKPPPGYLPVDWKLRAPGDNEIIPHSGNFSIIKNLWQYIETGLYSVADIKRLGDTVGLLNRNKVPYSKNTYHKIFTNEFYCGFYYWKNDEGKMMRIEGKHKPMISYETFLKVQKILHKGFETRYQEYAFVYRGLIKCGECGGHVTAEQKLQAICTTCKHKFSIKTKQTCPQCRTSISNMNSPTIIDIVYYHCTKNAGFCTQKSITETEITDQILTELGEINISQDFYNWGAFIFNEMLKQDKSMKDDVIPQLKKRESELINRSNGLIKMRADGEISSDELRTLRSSLQDDINKIRCEIERERNYQVHTEKSIKNYLDFARNALEEFNSGTSSIKKAIVSKLASNLTLKGKKLYFSIDNVYSEVKECDVTYQSKKACFEPKKDLINYTQNPLFISMFPFLSRCLTAIRTCKRDIFLTSEEREN